MSICKGLSPAKIASKIVKCACIVLLSPCILCYGLYCAKTWSPCGTESMKQHFRESHRKRRKRNMPVPLPEQRRRRPSLTLGKTRGQNNASNPAEPSMLLQLPVEVRDIIWGFAMGGRRLHITSGEEATRHPRLVPSLLNNHKATLRKTVYCHGYVDCSPLEHQELLRGNTRDEQQLVVDGRTWSCYEGRYCQTCAHFFDIWGFGEWERLIRISQAGHNRTPGTVSDDQVERLRRPRSADGWNPLALLQTCRMVYREVLPYLYRNNTFLLLNEEQAINWPSTLLASTRTLVKSIHLTAQPSFDRFSRRFKVDGDYDFPAALNGLAKFENLRELQIDCGFENQLLCGSEDSVRYEDALLRLGDRIHANGGEVLLQIPSNHNKAITNGAKGIRVVVESG